MITYRLALFQLVIDRPERLSRAISDSYTYVIANAPPPQALENRQGVGEPAPHATANEIRPNHRDFSAPYYSGCVHSAQRFERLPSSACLTNVKESRPLFIAGLAGPKDD